MSIEELCKESIELIERNKIVNTDISDGSSKFFLDYLTVLCGQRPQRVYKELYQFVEYQLRFVIDTISSNREKIAVQVMNMHTKLSDYTVLLPSDTTIDDAFIKFLVHNSEETKRTIIEATSVVYQIEAFIANASVRLEQLKQLTN